MNYAFLSKLHETLLNSGSISYTYNKSNEVVLDLITIMGAIYCADISTKGKKYRPREISLSIPVFNIEKWMPLKQQLEELSKWVSEDIFILNFEKNNFTGKNKNLEFDLSNGHPVSLFSGGLDSLSGAYFNFKSSQQSDYVGFINKFEEKTHQLRISEFYRKTFSSNTEINLVEKPNIKKEHFTQSTRSLLYLALSVAKSHFNNGNKVYLFENGILSLNPEIYNRYTTKTTHPKTIFLYNSILNALNLNIKIEHPFLFKTKGEIINEMNKSFKREIKNTFTCGASRMGRVNHSGQCGVCIPCLLRKISIAAFNNEVYDVKYHYPYEIKFHNINEEKYRKEYEANYHYFQSYYRLIKQNVIHTEVDIKKVHYPENENYLELNAQMFGKFAIEFERFMKKYDPY